MAISASAIETPATRASPGIDACTSPFLSASASMVIQTIRVLSSSVQIVEVMMELKSFV